HTTFSRDWSSDVCSSDLEKADEARDVKALLGLRKGAADDHILYILRIDTGFLEQALDHLRGHFIGTNLDKLSLVGESEGRTRIARDYNIFHCLDFLSSHMNRQF